MQKANDSIHKRLFHLMEAAERLEDARDRITAEEISLLTECSSRLRLIQGFKKDDAPSMTLTVPKRAVAN